jgi:hypothetical protein
MSVSRGAAFDLASSEAMDARWAQDMADLAEAVTEAFPCVIRLDYGVADLDVSAMNQATGTSFWNGLGTTGKGMAILAGTNLAGGLIQGAAAQSQANEARNRYNTNVGTRLWKS